MRRLVVLGLVTALATVLLVPAASAKSNKVDVCHRDGTGEWRVISVSDNGKAVQAHQNHGDVLPGDPVAGMPGYRYDGRCVPIDFFAVAYTDMDTSDGGYNPAVDVLIAKLVDGPTGSPDGAIGPGDIVETYKYPASFDGSAFGDLTVNTHTVIFFFPGGPDGILVVDTTGNNFFDWFDIDGDAEGYQESGPTASDFTLVIDHFTAGLMEGVSMSGVSPSVPNPVFSLNRTSAASDDAFVDVDLWHP